MKKDTTTNTATITLTDATFDEAVNSSVEPILVDFWAEWCGPCKAMEPTLEQIAAEQRGKLKVAKLNVDDSPRTAQRFSVMSIPTMILFRNGEIATKVVGAKPKAALMKLLVNFI